MILSSLIRARFLRRYKRFFVDCQLENGEVITAHCPNSGSMKSLLDEENGVLIEDVSSRGGKLKYKLHFVFVKKSSAWVLLNTMLPNVLVREAIEMGSVCELAGYELLRPEVKYGVEGSRIDLLLESSSRPPCFVEVKNVTLLEEEDEKKGIVRFPDSVSSRGAKHLRELCTEVEKGNRAVMFYLVDREDGNLFGIAGHIDKKYKEEFEKALESGVEVLVYKASFVVSQAEALYWRCEIAVSERLELEKMKKS
ncbi:DNA/RNA nuclease SfsA [Candidatus Woesearchaeota archaeon]|nr:DNA/RNA nuclease SfsA [Nanoarchaeota archaeon]MCB9370928.1 DNA/RNA nuclease SfsA [Candidatus Woesearchaeota archaeon]USN44029.1 MAG: DNA/RNA nuclease SfsA [Candidatus Woesearchaeota archaeon]